MLRALQLVAPAPLLRCTNPPKEEEEEGEEGAAKPKEPEPEKETPALTPASEDVC